jgi:L,D-peptidoglycan transpeptidase YkuD (ErfK/YbiS/YcfS/YnhG family)
LADNNSYWDENSGSPTYNRWVESNPGGDNEQLKNQPLYKYDSPAETPDDLPVIA